MLNMDMIGRLRNQSLFVGGVGTSPIWKPLLEKLNGGTAGSSGTGSGSRFQYSYGEDGFGPSDHQSFYLKKMPVLFFFTGIHENYHKPSDTVDRINFPGMAKVADMAEGIIAELITGPRLEYVKTGGYGTPFDQNATPNRAVLGVTTAETGSKNGVAITAVAEKGAAEKAGLKEGDRILSIGGQSTKNVDSLMMALEKCRPGREVDIVIQRNGEEQTLKITPTRQQTPSMPKARLGVMPDYSDESDGMLLQGVTPGGAAEKAGLKEGDRIVELAGKPVTNVTSYMTALDACKAGKEVEVVVKRKNERITVKVTPQ